MPWVIRKAESISEHLEKWKQSENLVSVLQLKKLQECNWVRLFVELAHHPYHAAALRLGDPRRPVESNSSVAKLIAPAGIHELGCAHRKKSSKGCGEKIGSLAFSVGSGS